MHAIYFKTDGTQNIIYSYNHKPISVVMECVDQWQCGRKNLSH